MSTYPMDNLIECNARKSIARVNCAVASTHTVVYIHYICTTLGMLGRCLLCVCPLGSTILVLVGSVRCMHVRPVRVQEEKGLYVG